jgi:hypothetical protein
MKYGLVLFLSKNIAFHSDFQNFFPEESVIKGQVKAYDSQSYFFLIISVPVTKLPH